jgi:hypothetical protein
LSPPSHLPVQTASASVSLSATQVCRHNAHQV